MMDENYFFKILCKFKIIIPIVTNNTAKICKIIKDCPMNNHPNKVVKIGPIEVRDDARLEPINLSPKLLAK